MSERRHPQVVNIEEAEVRDMTMSPRFASSAKNLGQATGGQGIGCSYYEVRAGKTAFPSHWHSANEESMYVLEGSGALRIGEATVRVGAGDYVTFPIGPEHAHQLHNDGDSTLRYLCFSTLRQPEVVGYPDSKKLALWASPGYGQPAWARAIFKEETKVGYLEGERTE